MQIEKKLINISAVSELLCGEKFRVRHSTKGVNTPVQAKANELLHIVQQWIESLPEWRKSL
jgi:hypothetical protein